ncbi:MAG TPA: hypothetical protein V6D05_12195 [Stenomitos sp.]
MVEAMHEHAVAANIWLIAVMAFFHVGVMMLLGLAIWRTMTFRAPLHEEFIGAMPHERPEPAPVTDPAPTVLNAERRDTTR